jgi:glycosyltransferase involved in cell wall biosynthesis
VIENPEKKIRVGYVTDLPLTPAGGGSYGVNWHAYRELARCFAMTYHGPIVPRQPRFAKLFSKVKRRILGVPGRYTYFSETTLDSNARAVASRLTSDVDAIVFRSAGRWCRVRPTVPYFIYLDAVVHTFFHNTFNAGDFDRDDLSRIFEQEARFLESADAVFFESKWGMQQAREAYSLKGSHYVAVGRGGVIEPPERDKWDGSSHSLVSIAMNFKQKGGHVVLNAYRTLKARFASLTWDIVGGDPGFDWTQLDGIRYHGVLDPNEAGDRLRLETILQNAFLLVHPTTEDTSPLVITEAAYFGCPSISVNAFAVPELIVHGVTGLLMNTASAGALVAAVTELFENKVRYRDMRHNARELALSQSRWEKVGGLMCDRIAATLR